MPNPLAGITVQDYLAAAKALLPRGRAFLASVGSVQEKVLLAIADTLAAVHANAIRVVDVECDPHTTDVLLPDFETAWGLPAPCLSDPGDDDNRRRILLARIGDNGGLNKQRFIDLCATLGVAVTVDELRPFTCDSGCDDPIFEDDARFVWRINIPETPVITEAVCTDPCDVPLRDWGDQTLECAVMLRNRASRTVLFAYLG